MWRIFQLLIVWVAVWLVDAQAQRLSRLAPEPDWGRLEAYQGSITREDFVWLLEKVYSPDGAWRRWIEVAPERALITTKEGRAPWELRFAGSADGAARVPRYWRGRAELPPAGEGRPLEGMRIVLDPGHIGGRWARMEERWFQIGNSKPVVEGDMVLVVAKLLKERLEELGARVMLTRTKAEPVTRRRPRHLLKAARASLADRGVAVTERRLQVESEVLFYRVSEIRERAKLVNERFQPDLVLCLHFNAEAWGNPDRPRLVAANHLHVLINGAYSEEELTYEDQRFGMLLRLLSRVFAEEKPAASALARGLAEVTGLPPFIYKGASAVDIGAGPYVWARNLLANRLFEAPTVFLEPYVMNNREVWERVQAGDYEGLRMVAGRMRPSLYREYVDGVVRGLVGWYGQR